MWHSQKKAHGFYLRDFELTCPAWAHALLCFKSSPSGSITDSIQPPQQFVIYSAQQGSVSVVSDISCLWVLVALQIMEQIAMVLAGWGVWQTWVILAGILKNMDPGKKTEGAVEQWSLSCILRNRMFRKSYFFKLLVPLLSLLHRNHCLGPGDLSSWKPGGSCQGLRSRKFSTETVDSSSLPNLSPVLWSLSKKHWLWSPALASRCCVYWLLKSGL